MTLKRTEVSLAEVPKLTADVQDKVAVAYVAPVKLVTGEDFRVVVVVPPEGLEFADLAMPLQLYLDVGELGDRTPIETQRLMARAMKKARLPKRFLPNEGLHVSWSPWRVEFVASAKACVAALGALDVLKKEIGPDAFAPRNSSLPLVCDSDAALGLWTAIVDRPIPRSAQLARARDLLDAVGKQPLHVPPQLRYQLPSMLGLISDDLIDETCVIRAAIVNGVADPCFAFGVASLYRSVTSQRAKKLRVLEAAPTVRFMARTLRWEKEVTTYLKKMHNEHPAYFARLPGCKNEPWDPLLSSIVSRRPGVR